MERVRHCSRGGALSPLSVLSSRLEDVRDKVILREQCFEVEQKEAIDRARKCVPWLYEPLDPKPRDPGAFYDLLWTYIEVGRNSECSAELHRRITIRNHSSLVSELPPTELLTLNLQSCERQVKVLLQGRKFFVFLELPRRAKMSKATSRPLMSSRSVFGARMKVRGSTTENARQSVRQGDIVRQMERVRLLVLKCVSEVRYPGKTSRSSAYHPCKQHSLHY